MPNLCQASGRLGQRHVRGTLDLQTVPADAHGPDAIARLGPLGEELDQQELIAPHSPDYRP